MHGCVKYLAGLLLFGLIVPAGIADSAVPARTDQLLSRFGYLRKAAAPALLPSETGKVNLAVRLDNAFYASINDLSKDLRIVNASGKEVPFVLSKVTSNVMSKNDLPLPGRLISKQPLPDGRLNIDFELDKFASAINSVELIGLKSANNAVISIAVGDGKAWQYAFKNMPIADTSALPTPTDRKYPFNQVLSGKIVRFTVEKGTLGEFDAVRVCTTQSKRQPDTALSVNYMLTEIQRTVTDSEVRIICETSQLPLTGLRFGSKENFYFCHARILGSNDRKKWFNIASGTVSKIDLEDKGFIDFPEKRCQYMQITLYKPQAGKLPDLQLHARGNCYEWLLPANKHTMQEIKIYYGANSFVPAPQQIANFAADLPQMQYKLYSQERNPLCKTGVRDQRNLRYLIGSLIILTTAAVFVLILRWAKNNKEVLPAD